MKPTKAVKLTQEQLELLVETLASAKIEANFASQKKHVMFLPDLFKTLNEYEKDLASLLEIFKIALKETYYEKISNL
jgi:hypothetical protein